MISRNITLNSIEEAVEFVNKMSRYSCTVELSKGFRVVNAKSLLGVLSLGLGESVRMDIYKD